MKIEEIDEMWSDDCTINIDRILVESVEVPKLHHKYYSIYVSEKIAMLEYEAKLIALTQKRREWYTTGLCKEELDELGWPQYEGRTKVLKTELDSMLQSDSVLTKPKLILAAKKEKVEFLKSILNEISRRSFHIKNYIEQRKIEEGLR